MEQRSISHPLPVPTTATKGPITAATRDCPKNNNPSDCGSRDIDSNASGSGSGSGSDSDEYLQANSPPHHTSGQAGTAAGRGSIPTSSTASTTTTVPTAEDIEWRRSSEWLANEFPVCADFLPATICPFELPVKDSGSVGDDDVAWIAGSSVDPIISDADKQMLYQLPLQVTMEVLSGKLSLAEFGRFTRMHYGYFQQCHHPSLRFHAVAAIMIALDRAVWLGHTAAWRLLLQLYQGTIARPFAVHRITRWIVWCSARGHIHLLRHLPVLQCGGAVARAMSGHANDFWLAIHAACAAGSVQCVKYLLAHTPPSPPLPAAIPIGGGSPLNWNKVETTLRLEELPMAVPTVGIIRPAAMHPSTIAAWPTWQTDCEAGGVLSPLPLATSIAELFASGDRIPLPVYCTDALQPLSLLVAPLVPEDSYDCLLLALRSGNVALVKWLLTVIDGSVWFNSPRRHHYLSIAILPLQPELLQICLQWFGVDDMDNVLKAHSTISPLFRSIALTNHRMAITMPCAVHLLRQQRRSSRSHIDAAAPSPPPVSLPSTIAASANSHNGKCALIRWYADSHALESAHARHRIYSAKQILKYIFTLARIA